MKMIVLLMLLAMNVAATERWVFPYVGQSNLTRGDTTMPNYPAAERIYVHLGGTVWRRLDAWADPKATVDGVPLYPPPGGVALAFAERIAELNPDVEIGLVPCAVPSTRIEEHRPAWSRSTYYGSCVIRTLDAGAPRGLLVWVAENNTMNAAWASTWFRSFAELIRAWRVDVGDLKLPVVVAKLHYEKTPVYAYWNDVRDDQAVLEGPYMRVVSTDGAVYPDGVHADAAGRDMLGRRLAESMMMLMNGAH